MRVKRLGHGASELKGEGRWLAGVLLRPKQDSVIHVVSGSNQGMSFIVEADKPRKHFVLEVSNSRILGARRNLNIHKHVTSTNVRFCRVHE